MLVKTGYNACSRWSVEAYYFILLHRSTTFLHSVYLTCYEQSSNEASDDSIIFPLFFLAILSSFDSEVLMITIWVHIYMELLYPIAKMNIFIIV